jgi:hypothetical protein
MFFRNNNDEFDGGYEFIDKKFMIDFNDFKNHIESHFINFDLFYRNVDNDIFPNDI